MNIETNDLSACSTSTFRYIMSCGYIYTVTVDLCILQNLYCSEKNVPSNREEC